jgi:hypothetical protein
MRKLTLSNRLLEWRYNFLMKIYVAGKDIPRAQSVMDALIADGHVITYNWIATLDRGPTKEVADTEAEAVRTSDLVVYLWESNQESARYEAGMAMGLKIPIVVSGNSAPFFFQLDTVYCVESDDLISQKVKEVARL